MRHFEIVTIKKIEVDGSRGMVGMVGGATELMLDGEEALKKGERWEG